MNANATVDMQGKIELIIPRKPEFLRIVRLVVSGYASRLNLPFDEVEGIKVAVSEACNNAIIHGGESEEGGETIAIRCWEDPDGTVAFQVEDAGPGFDAGPERRKTIGELNPENETGFGLMLIESLMDSLEVESSKGRGARVTMKKKLAE